MNLCRACGEDFGSLDAFDAHRVGKHDYLFSLDQLDGRRCLHRAEMSERGFVKNAYGRWTLEKVLTTGRSRGERFALTAAEVTT